MTMCLPNLVKVAVIKDQEKFILGVKALHRVRNSLGEVPYIAIAELCNLVPAVLVDGRHSYVTSIDEAPFGLLLVLDAMMSSSLSQALLSAYHSVPVQLSNSSLLQMKLSACNVWT